MSPRRDPIEDDLAYREIIEAAEAEARANLDERGVEAEWGFCHLFWWEKKDVLRERYGIDWSSPAELNPDVRFD